MKKLFSISLVLIIAAFLILLRIPLKDYAHQYDSRDVEISFSGAPEGTYYVDMLIKMDSTDGHYTDFNAPPQCYVRRDDSTGTAQFIYTDLPGITSDSGIAKYNTDGYVSLLCHYSVAGMTIWNSEYNIDGRYRDINAELKIPYGINGSPRFTDLFKQYGAFKAAYVDKDGNVLGVSGKARRSWSMSDPYALIADGSKLTFRIWGNSPAEYIAFYTIIIGVPLLIILSIITRIQNAVWKRHTINKIKEADDKKDTP